MASLNISSISSGEYADMLTSVASVKTNKVLLDNISNVYNYENIIQLPMTFLRKYENIIKTNLEDYTIDKSRFYRPEYVSYDLYGTTDLWYLILFVNDLKTPLELNYEQIKVPSTAYILEILNKLKTIDGVKSTHDNPIYIHRSLLKDINSKSDKIIDSSNSFIKDNTIDFIDNIDRFKDTGFKTELGYLSRDIYYSGEHKDGKESPVNFGFRTDYIFNKSFSLNNKNDSFLNYFYKNLKSDTVYYLFKRYCGYMDLTIENEKYKINKTLFENELVNFTPTILTYDLREATLAPEYLKENLILKYGNEVYQPEILLDKNNNEFYGIKIGMEKYEIFFDGTAYYIVLEENDNEKTVALLENKNNNGNIYHSINEWKFNDPNNNLIKLDEDSDNLYFNENYYYLNGEYVYTLNYNKDNIPVNNENNIVYRIDINRDLQSNNNTLDKYEFLGFEFNVNINIDDINNKEILDNINLSPLKITIITEDNEEYNFSYPYGKVPNEIEKSLTNYMENYIDKENYLYKYKRIIPIIKTLNNKEKIKIKEILVSSYIGKINSDYNFENDFNISISCGTLKIYGFKYEDMIEEFITPNANTDYINYKLSYYYNIEKTRYTSNNESNYFEPTIIEKDINILELLDDKNNLDYSIKNNFNITNVNTIIPSKLTENNTYAFELSLNNYNFSNYDYFNFELYDLDVNIYNNQYYFKKKFNLEYNFILEVKINNIIENNFNNNLIFLNGFTLNNNKGDTFIKNCLHQNFQLLFNKVNDNYYYIHFGEGNYTTNKSFNRKDNPYINNNLYLNNFNSYSFSVDTNINGNKDKVNYYNFKNIFIDKDNYIKKIIKTKNNNNFYFIPGGIYKSLSNEGNTNYQYYKYIESFKERNYPILQTKVFSNHYFDIIQNNYKLNQNTIDYNLSNEIYIKIKKINDSFYIYYKFDNNEKYKKLYDFKDFYKIINNGTLGLRFFNTIPYKNFEIINYQIEKLKN